MKSLFSEKLVNYHKSSEVSETSEKVYSMKEKIQVRLIHHVVFSTLLSFSKHNTFKSEQHVINPF